MIKNEKIYINREEMINMILDYLANDYNILDCQIKITDISFDGIGIICKYEGED